MMSFKGVCCPLVKNSATPRKVQFALEAGLKAQAQALNFLRLPLQFNLVGSSGAAFLRVAWHHRPRVASVHQCRHWGGAGCPAQHRLG